MIIAENLWLLSELMAWHHSILGEGKYSGEIPKLIITPELFAEDIP